MSAPVASPARLRLVTPRATEHPVVQPLAAIAQAALRPVVRTCDVTVKRNRDCCCHHCHGVPPALAHPGTRATPWRVLSRCFWRAVCLAVKLEPKALPDRAAGRPPLEKDLDSAVASSSAGLVRGAPRLRARRTDTLPGILDVARHRDELRLLLKRRPPPPAGGRRPRCRRSVVHRADGVEDGKFGQDDEFSSPPARCTRSARGPLPSRSPPPATSIVPPGIQRFLDHVLAVEQHCSGPRLHERRPGTALTSGILPARDPLHDLDFDCSRSRANRADFRFFDC